MAEATETDKVTSPVIFPMGKREADIAADIRAEMDTAMAPVLAIFAKAATHGIIVGWESIGPDAFGRFRVNGLKLIKHL